MIINAHNLEEVKQFEQYVIRHPLERTIHTVKFTDKFYIETDGVRALLNIYLQEVYEYYQLPLKVRAKLIYSYDYGKGVPKKYKTLVKDTVMELIPEKEIHLYFILGMVVSCFHWLSIKLSLLISMDFSMWGFLDAYDNNKEFKNLMDNPLITEVDPPWEVQRKEKEIIRIFKESNVYPVNLMFDAGVKINDKQAQALVQIGPMPGYIDKNRTQHNVLGGILNGIKRPVDMFQMDNSGRLVIISGKTEVKEPGTINKHVGVSLASFKLNEDVTRDTIYDCKTPWLLEWDIKSEKDLTFLNNKYIVENGKIAGHVHPGRKDLIGKTIQIRSALFDIGDTICEVCMGYLSTFLKDTSIWKSSVFMYVMDVIGALVQNLISIKHNNSAKMLETRVMFRGKIYTIQEFYYAFNKNIIKAVEFDYLRFYEGINIDYFGWNTEDFEDKPFRKNWYLTIDGEPLIFDQPIYDPKYNDDFHKDCIKYYIPNDSVFIKADDLKNMLIKHNKKSKEKEENEWSDRVRLAPASRTRLFDQESEEYTNMSVQEQIVAFLKYCMDVSEFDHIIYYEALVYGLMRDGEDPKKRLHAGSKSVQFFNIENILSTPGMTNSLSVKLHHGYIKYNILVPRIDVEPSEFDVVYNKLWDREPAKYYSSDIDI